MTSRKTQHARTVSRAIVKTDRIRKQLAKGDRHTPPRFVLDIVGADGSLVATLHLSKRGGAR